jgi:hypothetical protein
MGTGHFASDGQDARTHAVIFLHTAPHSHLSVTVLVLVLRTQFVR